MKFNVEPTPASITQHNQSYRFILNVQSASTINDLWSLLLQKLGEKLLIKQAELIYRAGILSERLGFDQKGITHKPLTNKYSFPYSRKEYDCKISKKKIVIFKRVDTYCAQLELQFEDTDTEGTGINLKKEAYQDELLLPVHIFLNQLFLLFKMGNFEFHSIKDGITSAYNQNYLKDFIQNEIERARRYSSVFSVIFFDLDNLKAINEKYGHLIGTEVLKEVAAVLRAQVRKIDMISRFGGDEFAIVLLHADAKKAFEVANRIKTAIKKSIFLKNRNLNLHVTGCFGISSFPENGNTVEELIRKSDLAMYDVKHTGKDGIKIYEE